MIFFLNIHKTALFIAVEKENIEIVQFLLSIPSIDVNKKCILICIFKLHFLENICLISFHEKCFLIQFII